MPNRNRWSYLKTHEDLERAFLNQISNMRRSCDSYDSGAFEEAERLAAIIYILVHDGLNQSRSKSLLGMLNKKAGLRFWDIHAFGTPSDPRVVTYPGPMLVLNVTKDGNEIRPALPTLERDVPKVSFSTWWDTEIYQNNRGHSLTRKNLVFSMRDQDGGAHVDASRNDESYHQFASSGDLAQWSADRTLGIQLNGSDIDVSNAHRHLVRVIAHEVEQTLIEGGLAEPR